MNFVNFLKKKLFFYLIKLSLLRMTFDRKYII